MKKWILVIIIIIVLASALVGYFYFNPKYAVRIIVPEFENIEMLHITFLEDTALVQAYVKFQNKSFLKLDVDSLIYNIKLDTFTFLSRRQPLFVRLKPSCIDTVFLPLALPFNGLMKEIRSLRKNDSTSISFDLKVIYSTWFGRAVLPYKKTIRISVPVPPKLELEKLEYKSRHKNSIHFEALVKVINEGNIKLHLSEINYHLLVRDNFSAEGNDNRQFDLDPHSVKLVTLPIQLEFKNLLATLFRFATNRKVHYKVKINARARLDKLSPEGTILHIEKEGITELKK